MSARDVMGAVTEVVVSSPRFIGAPLVRSRHLRWGATDEEVAACMPGDEIVPQASFNATRAITIGVSPDQVWPWLVQLGFGRAGWYSYDLFDNAARPSARRILPEFQHPAVGDWVPMSSKVNETTAFKVKELDPNRVLLWEKPNSTWAWSLTPLGSGRETRLVTRIRQYYDWRGSPATTLLTVILFELGDFPMMRKLLIGLKDRAEGGAR